jgi:DNA-binding response OmpR family regulator
LIIEVVRLTLSHGVYVTHQAGDLAEAIAIIGEWAPQLAVLDMELGGREVIGELRKRGGPALPVLVLTRRGDLKTKLAAFEQGVDDIITVPFAPEELLARVVALIRRSYGTAPQLSPVIHVGELAIDILNRDVRIGASAVHLTGLEQHLLYLLAANPGRVVTRDQILDALWGTDFIAESNIVDRHVRNLRAKLRDDWRHPRFIATAPGRGYRFIPTSSGG